MKQITYDYQRLRKAIVLLLDPKFGETRENNVREAIKLLPHGRGFTRTVEPLNELMNVARQSPTKALDILDMVPKKRRELEADRRKAAPNTYKVREILRVNIANYRARLNHALKTEEIRLQRKLTAEEAKKFLDDKKRLWNMRYEQYRNDHPEMKLQEARAAFAKELNEEIKLRYERAVASGAIKATPHNRVPLSQDKVRNLQRKFNR